MLRKSLLGLALALFTASAALAQSDAFGYWTGSIGPGVLDLGVNVLIEGTEEEPTAVLDIPVQGLIGFPLSEVTIDGNDVSFAMAGVPGDPRFSGTADGDTLSGTFSQSGAEFEFVLERSDEESAGFSRPQEPERPFPYTEEEVTLHSPAGDVTLAGTLTLPEDGEGPFTALLFLTGSGPQDRDETLFEHRPFLVLSDALTRAGYATLRLDDRGMGGSTGLDHEASYEDLTSDAVTAVNWLQAREDIGAIGIIGHSQGGYLAPVVAAETDIDFIISLAGPSVSGLEVLELQNRLIYELEAAAAGGVSPEELEAAIEEQIAFLRELHGHFEAGDIEAAEALGRERIAEQLEGLELSEEEREQLTEAQLLGIATPSMASFMTFDPQPFLRQLDVPLLAVFGGLDIQVDAEQSIAPLEEALAAADTDDYTVVTIEDMNHLLQPAETGSLDEYILIETTIHPQLLELLLDWLAERY